MFRTAEAHEFALLNDAQELRLCFRADGGDFIEEDGALVRDFEKAFLGGDGAGESAPHMAEKLRLEEIHGDRARIHGHEGLVGARRGRMDRLSNELFARSALAADQDCGARGRDLRNQVQKHLHFVTLTDDAWEIEALLESALQLEVFIAKPSRFHGLGHLREQFIVGPRLRDVVHCAIFEGGAGHIDRTVGGNEDDRELGIASANFFQHVKSVAVRQADVQQQEIEGMLFELGEPGFAGFGAGDAVAFALEQKFETFANFGFVVNN